MSELSVLQPAPLMRASAIARATAEILRPARRVTPTAAAAGKLANDRGTFDPNVTPYLVEPLDRLADRNYQGIVFVGPARTGKTFGLALGGVYYVVTIAPADTLMVYMSQDTARDFSRLELDRAITHTPELGALLSPRARDDNTYDKFFRNGIALKIGWPASSQLRGKTVKNVFLMDYDGGATGDVDHRGSMWGQAFKRIETYLSRGKCLGESSPGFEYDDAKWKPTTPHEAPPARGIASIYNTGTRARWYWPCQHCGQHFQAAPGLAPFCAPTDFEEILEEVQRRDLMTLAEAWARVPCPHCGALNEPAQRSAMNARRYDGDRVLGATWLHEGQSLVDCRLDGAPRRTNVASYWLGGVAAAYQPWVGLMHTYLAAVANFARTGDEADMRRSTLEDQALPYLPMALRRRRQSDTYANRKESWPRGIVPRGVRFLTAAADVQLGRFVVQVHGWGRELESWLVDRFTLFTSTREEDGRLLPLNPAAYLEDWLVLRSQMITRSYRYADTELELRPVLTLCDSGGADGVTDKAYAFWRDMRDQYLGDAFRLSKGTGAPGAPRVHEAWPDSRGRSDRSAGRGDVPVWMLNTNLLKDGVSHDLSRPNPGPGFVHIPDWVDDEYFAELAAEVRTAKGWTNPTESPNEAFDLHVYNRAICIIVGAEAINWDNPPEWAAEPVDRKPPPPPQPRTPSGFLSTPRQRARGPR